MKHLSNNNFNNNQLDNVPLPVDPSDAANKEYVDTALLDRAIKKDFDVTVTVGSGGDYSTVNSAIESLSQLYPTYRKNGFVTEVQLLSGFVMAEQVLIKNSDLGWITITSVDSVVSVDPSAMVEGLIPGDNATPIFGGVYNSTLPIIGVQFEYADNTTSRDGVVVGFNSNVLFLPETGVRNCRHGIKVLYGSTANCYMPGLTVGGGGSNAGTTAGVDFSGTYGRSLQVSFNSSAGLARSNFNNNEGSYGVYVIWGSRADLYQSQIKNAGNTAICCRDGSFVNARATDVSGAGVNGYHALHGATINARYEESTPWGLGGANNCGGNGVLASNGGIIEAVDLPAQNCGSAGFSALENSFINAAYGNTTGSTIGVYARAGSVVNFKEGIANDATGPYAIYAQGSSTIDATGAIARRAADRGVVATSASNISLDGASITLSINEAIVAENGSNISAVGAVTVGSGKTAFNVFNGGTISANGASAATFNRETNVQTGQGLITTNAAPHFEQWGIGFINGDGDDTATGSITFPKPFGGLPHYIQITAIGNRASDITSIGQGSVAAVNVAAYNVSATGCQIVASEVRGINIPTVTRVGFSWVARGPQ